MRYAFAILIAIHGLIHLIGFAKAFYLTDVNKQVLGISKPIGAVWLIAFIMFIITIVSFLDNKKWFYIAFIAIIISQILITLNWKEAKFGTIANIIILLVSISAFAQGQFYTMVEKEVRMMQPNIQKNIPSTNRNDMSQLPEVVQRWMQASGVIGQEEAVSVRLKQVGNMRTKPKGKWMSFSATQHFNVENPAFVWSTKVNFIPIITMVGRDKLVHGKGEMLIKIASLIPVVNESNNEKINSGAMIRYLAEICWFPSAAMNEHITWETIDEKSARATLTIEKRYVSGIFKFNSDGNIMSFEANRYYGGTQNSQLEKWVIKMEEYKIYDGIKIPYKCNVTWELAEGDFNWLNLEITDLEYNNSNLY